MSDPIAVAGRPSREPPVTARVERRWRKAMLAVVVAAVGSISLLTLGGLAATPASAASGAPAVTQCDSSDFPITAGFQVTCSVSVENYTSATGATSSTVTTSACLAAAGVVYPSCPLNLGPVTSTTNSSQLVTSVNQCNGIVTGGGSNVYCNVQVTNNVPASTTESGVTVDQCIGSVTGMGGTVACAPNGSTTNATVTQCNGSVTGGGTYAGEPTAACTVTGAATADPVTINQCNGTATGGGSAVTCMAAVADVFAASTTTPTSAPAGTGGTNGASASATGGGSAGAGGAGGTTGVAGTSGTVAAVIPTGAPQTGFGGASRSTDSVLVYVGSAALVAAGLTMVLALHRRRRPTLESLRSPLS
ncbi:MAG: hypothetical protein WAL61_07985 [Acidimicrobiales bacterium]